MQSSAFVSFRKIGQPMSRLDGKFLVDFHVSIILLDILVERICLPVKRAGFATANHPVV